MIALQIVLSLGLAAAVPRPAPLSGLFSVVQFPNDACTASSGLTGTCVTSTECSDRGGTSGGSCAAGFGTCCLVASATCTSSATSITRNNTYLRNPGYPSTFTTPTAATTCAYTISKLNSNICQIRLDFQSLVLGQTASSGACTDTLAATTTAEESSTTVYPTVCGTSSGHHMYLAVGRTSTDTATVTISLATGSSAATWNVLASQIECDTIYTAPDGCTMYLTGMTGDWSMYGYVTGTTTTQYLQNQNYKVCIRREEGYCSIRHTTTTATSFDFSSGDNADNADGLRGAAGCYRDFINIPGGSLDGNPATFDRYCGGKLSWNAIATTAVSTNNAIVSKVLPFEITVHTDGTATAAPNTPFGAALSYQQLAC